MPIYLKLAIGWMIIVIGLATWNNPIGMAFFMGVVFTIAAILAILLHLLHLFSTSL